MVSYFIRHTNDPKADLERGFSFEGYDLRATFDAALANMADLSGDAYDASLLKKHGDENGDLDMAWYADEHGDRIGQDNVTGMWGQRRSGLCAYAEYATSDEACAALAAGDYAQAAGGDFAQYAVVYAGVRTRDERDNGTDDITFAPTLIVWTEKR